MRIFLDANVLFSAAKSDGAVRRVLGLLAAQGHVLCADEYVIGETHRNLIDKGPEGLASLNALLRRLVVAAHMPSVSAMAARSLPEKDRPVLTAAMTMGCEALVTGDKTHFGRFHGRRPGGVAIHSPRSLAKQLLE